MKFFLFFSLVMPLTFTPIKDENCHSQIVETCSYIYFKYIDYSYAPSISSIEVEVSPKWSSKKVGREYMYKWTVVCAETVVGSYGNNFLFIFWYCMGFIN